MTISILLFIITNTLFQEFLLKFQMVIIFGKLLFSIEAQEKVEKIQISAAVCALIFIPGNIVANALV